LESAEESTSIHDVRAIEARHEASFRRVSLPSTWTALATCCGTAQQEQGSTAINL